MVEISGHQYCICLHKVLVCSVLGIDNGKSEGFGAHPDLVWIRVPPFKYCVYLGMFYKSRASVSSPAKLHQEDGDTYIHHFVKSSVVWEQMETWGKAATGATQTSGMRKQTNVTRAPQTWTEKLHVPLLAGWPWVTLVNLTVLFPLIMERWILPCRTDVRIRGTVCEAPSTVPGTWWVLNSGT